MMHQLRFVVTDERLLHILYSQQDYSRHYIIIALGLLQYASMYKVLSNQANDPLFHRPSSFQSQPIHQLNPSDLKIPRISWTLESYLGPGFLPQRTSQRNCLFHVAVFEDFSLSKQSGRFTLEGLLVGHHPISSQRSFLLKMDPFKERRQYRIQKIRQQRLTQQGVNHLEDKLSSEEKSFELSIHDKHIIRQMKNRESAIRSRKRKDDLIDLLSSRIAILEKENSELRTKLQRTENMSSVIAGENKREGNKHGLASILRELTPMCF